MLPASDDRKMFDVVPVPDLRRLGRTAHGQLPERHSDVGPPERSVVVVVLSEHGADHVLLRHAGDHRDTGGPAPFVVLLLQVAQSIRLRHSAPPITGGNMHPRTHAWSGFSVRRFACPSTFPLLEERVGFRLAPPPALQLLLLQGTLGRAEPLSGSGNDGRAAAVVAPPLSSLGHANLPQTPEVY